ncbi:MAG: hypothetical protein ETSY2_05305 [Candidatus Entotheonella gemina]|uniref:Uncharacterized protein n=1 Tax=Candidatus Entotheonella gemina TaxID=1429439 RepID=W4MFN1_9BACT|nr:MAG: hypothetical protein ETSY2_05305 [Candidatus Entotheonella gemina]
MDAAYLSGARTRYDGYALYGKYVPVGGQRNREGLQNFG